jgi:hypothetical protein
MNQNENNIDLYNVASKGGIDIISRLLKSANIDIIYQYGVWILFDLIF